LFDAGSAVGGVKGTSTFHLWYQRLSRNKRCQCSTAFVDPIGSGVNQIQRGYFCPLFDCFVYFKCCGTHIYPTDGHVPLQWKEFHTYS